MKEISLYLHIPFCESKCFYCSFVSKRASEREKEKYITYLLKEIELHKNNEYLVKTVYIGGGTPSVLNESQIERIFEKIKQTFTISNDCEITIEANPNSFTLDKARAMKKVGVNRISFGLQSANDKLLKSINRIHTKKDFINAVNIAKRVGIENINADILIGLPKQQLKDVKSTLQLLMKLKIEHISCYTLILEENTKLFEMVDKGNCKLIDEDKTLKYFDYTLKYLKKRKIYRYEVSNFARAGKECLHNLCYWNLTNYLGLGLNSHSKIDNLRFENFADFESYYKELDLNNLPIKNKNVLTFDEMIEEYIMLGMRKSKGINLDEFAQKFHYRLEIEKAKEIDFLLKNKFIEIVNSNLFATEEGFKVLNQIIINLL